MQARALQKRSASTGHIAASGMQMHDGPRTQCRRCLKKAQYETKSASVGTHRMQTRSVTATKTSNALFNTTEMLQMILCELPEKDIITARGVNKYWNAVIMTSPRILRQLFLVPERTEALWFANSVNGRAEKRTVGNTQVAGVKGTVHARLNPLLFQSATWSHGLYSRTNNKDEMVQFLAKPSLTNDKSLMHNTFLCQPPTTEVRYSFEYFKPKTLWTYRRRATYVRSTTRNADGLTFGDILRAFRADIEARSPPFLSYDGFSIKTNRHCMHLKDVVIPTTEEIAAVEDGEA